MYDTSAGVGITSSMVPRRARRHSPEPAAVVSGS